MADPLGFIQGNNPYAAQRLAGQRPAAQGSPQAGEGGDGAGASFKDTLMRSLQEVNQAQQEATRAVEDLATGQRSDVEGVILATQKADNAFRMLQQLRNRMMEAFDEVKQMRV